MNTAAVIEWHSEALDPDSPTETESEAALIARFRDGDEDALVAIMSQHKRSLHRFIYRQTGDEGEAADLLSQTFIKAHRNRAGYQPKAKLSTWLFKIASNLCRDHARKRKRRPGDFARNLETDSNEEAATVPDATTPADHAARAEEAGMLRQAISELPDDLKICVVLCDLEGQSQIEAAEFLGITAKAVESRIYRAKKRLRAALTAKLRP